MGDIEGLDFLLQFRVCLFLLGEVVCLSPLLCLSVPAVSVPHLTLIVITSNHSSSWYLETTSQPRM